MICLVCNRPSIDGLTHPGCRGRYVIDGAFSAVSYKGIVKKLIYNFKYKPFLSDLKDSLVDLFYESLIQNELFIRTIEQFGTITAVPIPLHKSKVRSRGYNHAKILAEGLSKKLGLKTFDLLKRDRETKSQFGLNLKQRKENLSKAFSISSNNKSLSNQLTRYANVLLVDDILTTGTTLLEAARVLKRNGIFKVFGLTLARG